jgi:hypothetical protein
MDIDNIEKFVYKLKKHNQIALILSILMFIFAFPVGKFFSGVIKNAAFNNPQIQEMFQTYENIEIITEREKELKQEIVRLVATVRTALMGIAAGTGFLITLNLAIGGASFLERYFSYRRHLNIIEELYTQNQKNSGDTYEKRSHL